MKRCDVRLRTVRRRERRRLCASGVMAVTPVAAGALRIAAFDLRGVSTTTAADRRAARCHRRPRRRVPAPAPPQRPRRSAPRLPVPAPAAPPVPFAPAAPPVPVVPPLPPLLRCPPELPEEQAIAPKPANVSTKKVFVRCLRMVIRPFTRRSRVAGLAAGAAAGCRVGAAVRTTTAGTQPVGAVPVAAFTNAQVQVAVGRRQVPRQVVGLLDRHRAERNRPRRAFDLHVVTDVAGRSPCRG